MTKLVMLNTKKNEIVQIVLDLLLLMYCINSDECVKHSK